MLVGTAVELSEKCLLYILQNSKSFSYYCILNSVIQVLCHCGMANPEVAGGLNGFQIGREVVDIATKYS